MRQMHYTIASNTLMHYVYGMRSEAHASGKHQLMHASVLFAHHVIGTFKIKLVLLMCNAKTNFTLEVPKFSVDAFDLLLIIQKCNSQVWIASNKKYLQSKAKKEAKWKRKREEKKSPGRWTRSGETKLLAEKHKRIKKKQANYQQTTKNENKGKEEVVDVEQESEMNERLKKQKHEPKKEKSRTKEKRSNAWINSAKEKGVSNGRHSHYSQNSERSSWFADGKKEIEQKRIKRVQRSTLGRMERSVQKYHKLIIKALSDLIIDTKNTDYMFRMNILTLIANTLGSCENISSLKLTLLRNVFEGDDVSDIDGCSYILECASMSKVDRSKKEKKDIVYYGPVMFFMELYELIEESIESILIDKSEIKEKINENLIKFENDERLIQLRDRMKSYGTQTDSVEEDHVKIVTEAQQEERNNLQYIDEENDEKGVSQSEDELMKDENTGCCEKKDEEETGTSKKDEANNNNEEENEEEIIRKGREFSAEQRKKARQQERERKRKGKKEKDQIGSSSQDSPVFGIDNSLLGSQPTFDIGASLTYEKMKILSEKKKRMRLKSKYVNKTVDPAVELTKDEKLLGRSIFTTQEEKEVNIQSLAPGLEIDTSVIDVYVSILNYEENFKMTNMKCYFFCTSMMVPGILEDKTKEIDKKIDARYDRFHEMLSIQMENDVEKMQMEDVELVH
nr:peptidase C48, SUMO/sentrin/Ubl1 [Tanacetum cinerariifolium]